MARICDILRRTVCLVLAVAVLLCGCTAGTAADGSAAQPGISPESSSGTSPESPSDASPEDPSNASPESTGTPAEGGSTSSEGVEALLAEMTLSQKIGQLFVVRPDALDPSQSQDQIDDVHAEGVTHVTEEMAQTLERIPVGGVALIAKNIEDPEQLSAFIGELQAAGGGTLFIAVDEEGGLVSRLANHSAFELPKYTSAAAVGARGENAVREMGASIGGYLKEYGFNLDFAPVADVNTNPSNTVIGTRAFSSHPEKATRLAGAMAEGLREQGIIPTFKHFPGHGNTAEDSHTGMAVSYGTREEMAGGIWLPFLEAQKSDCIMIGHISVPDITGDMVPATLSRTVVTDILRGDLGFEGPVITDSLAMEAVTDNWGPGEAAVLALDAGCDLLLMPQGLEEAFDAVLAAVEDGTLTEARIDESVRRILECKMEWGILTAD